ncbi:hypothetical protein C0Q57_20935 [Streptomyces albidoflavus]|uniref:hypothetical protein n=1 Tax=Streptomyces albidoflavus TaxID=1886 RepID=UPI001021BD47|nr:hypothetical protein [Streptomyces albidoflavus]RZD63482.1 hypothetical protein C0Q57_20935 [Streptomyces albidoflavus]
MSSTARRSLLTATTAATLLGALWFVPSANASGTAGDTAPQEERAATAGSSAEPAGEELLLADSGSVDTTPYLVGGTAFLLVGAGFVAYSARRGPWVTEDAGLT